MWTKFLILPLLLISISVRAEEACPNPKPNLQGLEAVTESLAHANSLQEIAAQNSQSVKSTRWSFGAAQKGFEIYIPLLQKTIATSADYSSAEFAQALKNWQERNAYSPASGLLDLNAFMAFKKYWQDSRNIAHAFKEKKMMSISKRDRYQDPHLPIKEESLCKIGEKTYVAYQNMVEAARAAGISGDELRIVASNRDLARLRLLQKDVPQNRIGFSIAGNKSVHFTGRALDLYVGGDPVNSEASNRLKQSRSRAYRWLVANAESFGFKNYFYEPWHWEYVGKSD